MCKRIILVTKFQNPPSLLTFSFGGLKFGALPI